MVRRLDSNHFKSNLDMSDLYEQKQDKRTDRSRVWRCGNTRKRSEVVADFVKSSSVHGAAYVCSTGEKGLSKCVKFGYRVLFGFCVLAVISHIATLLQEDFSKQSTFINTINRDTESGYEGDPDHFPLYPRITICRRPFYMTDVNSTYMQLVEYVMLSLGPPFKPLTPTEVATVVHLVMHDLGIVKKDLPSTAIDLRERLKSLEEKYGRLRKSEEYNLRTFIEEHSINCSAFFSSCVALIYPVDCCELFSPVLTSDGRCFALKDGSVFYDFLRARPSIIFSFVIDLVTPPNQAHVGSEVGFRVYLSDPSIEAPVQLDQFEGQDVVPGIATSVRAALIKTDRVNLHTPLHGLWNTCPRWGRNDSETSDRYSYDVCEQELYFGRLKDACGCESVLYSAGPQTSRLCHPIDMYQCYIRAGLSNLSEALDTCKQPCTAYTYKTETSYMGMGGGINISRVEIMYNSKQYTLNEYRRATLSSLFSQIGGSLGLYLGASIITLVEIVGFVTSWLWYRLAPAKVANMCAKVKPQFYKGRLLGNLKTELVNY